MNLFKNLFDKEHFNAFVWLLVALAFALLVALDFHGVQYIGSWAGSLGKLGTGAAAGLVIAKAQVRTNPDARTDPVERAIEKLARALIIGACVLAMCIAV